MVADMPHAAHDSALYMSPAGDEKTAKLEAEVVYWKDKAASSSQRFADYENEIRVLQAQVRQQQRRDAAPGDPQQQASIPIALPPNAPPEMSGIARFGSLIGGRKPVAVAPQQPGAPGGSREKELEEALVKEQTRRIAAEQKVRAVNAEIEELSVTLFQQANEMVATERRENADLKAQLKVAERSSTPGADTKTMQVEIEKLKDRVKLLEQRDVDRRRRLEKLEAANKRIERVRTLLFPR